MTNFYVSTTAFRGQPVDHVIELAAAEGLSLEFSSGLRYREGMDEIFLNAGVRRLPHNYFPAPRQPFVLNLASQQTEILERSRAHCRRSIELAAQVNAPFYSAHAGFCNEPVPENLGRQFPEFQAAMRPAYWRTFVTETRLLCDFAANLGCKFLIENNVVIQANCSGGDHPFLCAAADEILRLIEDVDRHPALGILIDTGHLKVSAATLGFDRDEFIDAVAPWIQAFHHSDNDGRFDTNQPLTDRYWFRPHMRRFAECTHILEVHDQTPEQIRGQRRFLYDEMTE